MSSMLASRRFVQFSCKTAFRVIPCCTEGQVQDGWGLGRQSRQHVRLRFVADQPCLSLVCQAHATRWGVSRLHTQALEAVGWPRSGALQTLTGTLCRFVQLRSLTAMCAAASVACCVAAGFACVMQSPLCPADQLSATVRSNSWQAAVASARGFNLGCVSHLQVTCDWQSHVLAVRGQPDTT